MPSGLPARPKCQEKNERSEVNSGTFYFAKAEPYDWTSPQNDRLWQESIKSPFDPCPSGWRVPKGGGEEHNPLGKFTLSNGPWITQNRDAGHLFNSTVVYNGTAWYTACGWRSYQSGAFGSVLGHADIWFSTVMGNYAHNLYSASGNVSPTSSAFRGYAFPVRCIRE